MGAGTSDGDEEGDFALHLSRQAGMEMCVHYQCSDCDFVRQIVMRAAEAGADRVMVSHINKWKEFPFDPSILQSLRGFVADPRVNGDS